MNSSTSAAHLCITPLSNHNRRRPRRFPAKLRPPTRLPQPNRSQVVSLHIPTFEPSNHFTKSAMFRHVTTRLLSRTHLFSTTEVQVAPVAEDLFVTAWKRAMPNLDPPKTLLTFMEPRPSATCASSIPSKLTLNLISPYSSEFCNKEVDMVTVPATTGHMGILPGHVASISDLKPGLLSIHEGNEVKKYFISSGFVYVHSNSVTDIIAVEVVPLEQVDPTSVQKRLSEFTQKLSTASTDLEKAEAQIGLDVLSALNSSLL